MRLDFGPKSVFSIRSHNHKHNSRKKCQNSINSKHCILCGLFENVKIMCALYLLITYLTRHKKANNRKKAN